MIKGHVLDFVGLYRSILKDVVVYLPSTREDCERDLQRLITLSQTRGESSFTIDLPKLGKILDQALATGRLSFNGEPLSRSINNRTVIPRLFRELWSELFDDLGCLKQDIDPNIVFFLRTLLYVGKKRRKECSPRYLYEATKEFNDVEESLPICPTFWDTRDLNSDNGDLGSLSDRDHLSSLESGLLFERDRADSQLLDTIQRSADVVSSLLGEFLPSEWRFRHGPGAVADLDRSKDFKYDFPTWQPQLSPVFPYEEFGIANLNILDALPSGDLALHVEVPSVHIAVPKTQTGPRLIAKEPTCNQWAQQCIRDYLYTRVNESIIGMSIDFRNQQASREMALEGSLTGMLSTVDLKSASDRISCWLVQRVFRRNISLLHAMRASRTRFMKNELDKKAPSLYKLRKFSTQGSALTFPTQSLVFYSIVMGCLCYLHDITPKSSSFKRFARQVRIFGDDLIIPVEVEPLVRYALERVYLKVNQTKTFVEGNFRESCGMDAFEGHDVTPGYVPEVYEESKPQSVRTVVDVHNNFVKKGMWHTAAFLISTVPHRIRKWIPIVGPLSGAFGLLSFVGSQPTCKTRWNDNLHRDEARCITVKDCGESGASRHEGFANLLQYFTEDPSNSMLSWKSGMIANPHLKLKMGWVSVSDLTG